LRLRERQTKYSEKEWRSGAHGGREVPRRHASSGRGHVTYPDDGPAVVDNLVTGHGRAVAGHDPEDRRRLRLGAHVAPDKRVDVVQRRLVPTASRPRRLVPTARDLRRIYDDDRRTQHQHHHHRHQFIRQESTIHDRNPFNGLFSRTTWVSRNQKGYTNLDLSDARDDGVTVASAGPAANRLHLAADK